MRIALIVLFSTLIAAVGAADLNVPGRVQIAGKPQPNVVVWLESKAKATLRDAPRPVMDQRNLRFSPQVLAVQVGATVEFPNNDWVFHNVFSFRDGKKFDLGLYPIGARKLLQFDKPGVSRIFCNIHQQMAAYVVSVDSPYYSVSRGDGTFTLTGIPAGTYTYFAWRAGAPQLNGTFVAGQDQALEIRWP